MVYSNVVELCQKNKISIAKLERETGIGNGTIALWERRGSSPRVDTLKKVADYFGVTIDKLLAPDHAHDTA